LGLCGIDAAHRAASIGEVSAREDTMGKSYDEIETNFFQEK
jgi:hypothetical protein